jgi:glycosyltransferase involved in cell wall biosynthesis
MNKIKICHVITRMDWGGSPEIVRMLCAGLSGERFEVTLVTGQTLHSTRKTEEFFSLFRGRVVVVPSLKRDISIIDDWAALFQLFFFFRKNRFDVVHTHTAKAGFLGRTAAFFSGCRCIVHTPHGHNFYGYFGKILSGFMILLERLAALYTRTLVVLTRLEYDDYRHAGVCSANKLALINPAIENEFFSVTKAGKESARQSLALSDARIVGMIGRLEPVKGPVYFIESCRLLASSVPCVRFMVCGEGSLRRELEARVKSYGLTERFLFTGWREDIREILSCFDVLVLPSINEALGLVLLQAQACGVPIVASRVGGVAEAVRDNETGILVPSRDSCAIASAVEKLINDERMRSSMGKRGREWVAGRFTVENMIHAHEELYIRLLNV